MLTTLLLLVLLPPFPGDMDADCDVDLMDFTRFSGCFNGPNVPPSDQSPHDCTSADMDGDLDVDLVDFSHWTHYYGSVCKVRYEEVVAP